MFFILSKTLAVFLEPLAHPYILLVLAGLLRLLRRRRMMRVCVTLAVVLPLLYAVLPLSTWPLRMLEKILRGARNHRAGGWNCGSWGTYWKWVDIPDP